MVSEGVIQPSKEPPIWGHVMVIVGEEGDNFIILNPGDPSQGTTTINKQEFYNKWW
jgi:hypothetical protein